MNQKQDRIYIVRRTGLVARLVDEGLSRQRAEQLAREWDGEAERRGLERVSRDYRREAARWAHEKRSQTAAGSGAAEPLGFASDDSRRG